MGKGSVYAIQDACGPIKIGSATNLTKRLAELQVGNPCELTILASCPGSISQEKRLHALLGTSRVRGEWFAPTEEVQEVVRQMKEGRFPWSRVPRTPSSNDIPAIVARSLKVWLAKWRRDPLAKDVDVIHFEAHVWAEMAFEAVLRSMRRKLGPVDDYSMLGARKEFERQLWDAVGKGGNPLCEVANDYMRVGIERRADSNLKCRGREWEWTGYRWKNLGPLITAEQPAFLF